MSGSWRVSREGAVARFVLDTGRETPTLSPEILEDLAAGIERQAETGASAAIVASSTPGIFAAGADLRAIRALSAAEGYLYARTGQEALSRVARAACTTIAEIDGACFGGALDLAMACDIRIASDRARFAHPGPRLGIVTGWGGTVDAPRRIGTARARRLFRSGEVFDAGGALRLGLVDEVTPSGELRERVRAAAVIAAQGHCCQWLR
ncbi:MAG TPA: enoyl-CoA hydratase/isomerase family protein [Thermoanaerobaculia bacterium]|nr:enoyl-CoA hydratase/isomerase family protein [Thermoanaerobaculia bacterium]